MYVEYIPRIDHVAARFGHLLSFAVQHQPQADHVLIGHAVEKQRADGMQRVEPAARLVDRLADEVGGKLLAELLFVLIGKMPLCHRHGARVEPYIDQFGHALHASIFAFRAGESNLIHVRAVQVKL